MELEYPSVWEYRYFSLLERKYNHAIALEMALFVIHSS